MKATSRNIQHYNNNHQDDDSINFKSLILKYLSAWPFFLASIVLALTLAFLANQFAPPVYKIQSKFLIKEESNAIELFDNGTGGKNAAPPKGQKIANESIILTSRTIASHTLEQLPFDVEYYEEGLFTDPEIYRNIPISVEVDWNHPQLVNGRMGIVWSDNQYFQLQFTDSEYLTFTPGEKRLQPIEKPDLPQTHFRFGEWIVFPYGKILISHTGVKNSGALTIKIRDQESLIQQYTGDDFQIFPADKTSSILLLTLDTHQPEKGRDYLNTLMKVFLDNELSEKNTIARNTVNFIDRQLAGISDSLTYSQHKLEDFRSNNRTYNITVEGNTLFEKLSELEKSLSHEQFKLEYYLNLQKYLAREDYSEIVIPSGLGIEDPVLNRLIEELIRFQSDKSRFLATQTEHSPMVVEVTRKIKDLNSSIQEALKNVNRNARLLINDLSQRIRKIENQFGKLPETEQDLLNIQRSYSLNEEIYTYLLQQRAEASISLASNMPSNKIIEPAFLNLVPLRLRPLLNYFLAVLLGVIVPMGIISLKDFFSFKVNDIKEVERRLDVPVIGCIGRNKNRPSLVVLTNPRSRIAEAFRGLRTNIDFIFHSQGAMTILVTSSIAGEGKSFCSKNLASVYSVCGKKTIIVACDLRKPLTSPDLGNSNSFGLSNYLSGQIKDLNDIIHRTDFQNLDVLVSGPVPPNPAELLISNRFKELLQGLKDRYDVIVLDSSPIGLTNETLYLTRLADLTIFVLRHQYSGKSFLDDINKLKEKKGIKKLYAVVNDIEDKSLNHNGYGYGYYDDDQKKKNNTFKLMMNRISGKAAM